jgi:hypothetical protein
MTAVTQHGKDILHPQRARAAFVAPAAQLVGDSR